MSFPPIPFGSDVNNLSQLGHRVNNNTLYYLNSPDFPMTADLKAKSFTDRSENVCQIEEPLDLSFPRKSMTEEVSDRTDTEVLNLSQKSSRSQAADQSYEEIPNNVSLALIQQQRKELEQTSIVRSMLMSGCRTDGLDTSVNTFNVLSTVNGTGLQSPDHLTGYSPSLAEESKESELRSRKRSHSDSEEVEPQSDSNNLSDDSSPAKSKRPSGLPSKLAKLSESVISNDDQSPPPDGTGLFTCDQCDKTFSKQSSLARHKYEHSGMCWR